MASPKKSPALLALTASALAALGSGRAQAQGAVPASTETDYRFSYYKEGALPASHVTSGNGERYEVLTHQFRVRQPFGDDQANAVGADLTFETMSGASPMWVQPGTGGKPVDVMSGASIEDKRTDLTLSLSRHKSGTTGTLSGGYSKENDYKAAHGSVELARELADRVTTVSFGVGYSGDAIDPVQQAGQTRIAHANRHAGNGVLGVSRVLDEVTVVQATLGYTLHQGFLSDPYKSAYIVSTTSTVPDTRPDSRGQLTATARLRRFFKGADAALHLNYRYYHDDWRVDAHTVETSWQQNVGHGVRVAPGVRWYTQSQAFFYSPYYNTQRSDGLASSDYRLAPYGALSGNLTVNWDIAGWTTNLSYERYESGTGFALAKVAVENPGLVDFQTISLGLKKTF